MYIIPNRVNLALVPSQIFPVGALVAILKNGRYLTKFQKLRGIEPSLSTLSIGFLWRRFQKTYCQIHHAIAATILEAVEEMAAISKVIRLSQRLRGVEPSISTLRLGLVGHILAEKVFCRMCQYYVSTILTFMAAIFYNMAAISMNNVILFGN